jgi:preprotein translocase subunit YajC
MSGSLWEQVLASSIALLIFFAIIAVVYLIYSVWKTRKQRAYFLQLHRDMAVGCQVTFAGGLMGELVRVGEDSCDVKTKSGAVIEVSRFAIQTILTK